MHGPPHPCPLPPRQNYRPPSMEASQNWCPCSHWTCSTRSGMALTRWDLGPPLQT
uniref:Uncharacterized protein n=1 Tax=Arundo donax TaxID=35708 RepID=A0A0A9AL94_ARUDO